ncbi:hypothetical protein MKW92_035314, partial [Papaver armeniacum]
MRDFQRFSSCILSVMVFTFLIDTTSLFVSGEGGGGGFSGDYSKLSGIIIPGYASTQLRAWSILDCPYSPLDFNPLDAVWLDSTKLLSAVNCWLKCMLLDPYNQTDHPECKSRPDSGLSAITELEPGYITGPLSSVWKEWVRWCIEFGIEANAIIAVPYDWRITFETALKLRGGPSIVFAHSLGNNVFRYFLEWLKLSKLHQNSTFNGLMTTYMPILPLEPLFLVRVRQSKRLSLEKHLAFQLASAYYLAIGLSTCKPCSAIRICSNTYFCGCALYQEFFEGKGKGNHKYHCDDMEFHLNYSGWPTNIVNIEIPTKRGGKTYPSITEETLSNLSSMECGLPTQLSFSAREVSDGTLFKAMEDYDPDSKRLIYQLEKLYHGDPVLNPLTPWDRPPLKNVFCIYGIDSKTE